MAAAGVCFAPLHHQPCAAVVAQVIVEPEGGVSARIGSCYIWPTLSCLLCAAVVVQVMTDPEAGALQPYEILRRQRAAQQRIADDEEEARERLANRPRRKVGSHQLQESQPQPWPPLRLRHGR